MSQWEKLLERIQRNPRSVRFEEIDRILIRAGFERRQSEKGSSHFVYRKEAQLPLTIPRHGKHVGVVYVEQVIEALKKEGLL